MQAFKNLSTHISLLMRAGRFLGLSILVVISLFPFGDVVAGTLQDVRARGKLIAGVKTDFPSFGFLDKKGVNKGFDIDIAKAFSKEIFGNQKAVHFVSVTSENRIAFLNSGRIDLIAATLTITEERRRELDFSIPYFVTGHMILVRADRKITKYQDLAGKKVATIRGSTGDIAVGELVPDAERNKCERNVEALQALKEGRVEAFVQDFLLLYALLEKNPKLKMAGITAFPCRALRPGRQKRGPGMARLYQWNINEDEETGQV